MIRSLSLAAILAASFAMPAFAADEAADTAANAADVAGYTAQLGEAAHATQVRNLLNAQGYSNVSGLTQNESGQWVGSADKDGRTVGVAVTLPSKVQASAAASTN